MSKKQIVIVPLILCVLILIFIIDDWVRSAYEDPFRVGKMFCFSHVTQDSKHMKAWANKNVYKMIDNLQYSTRLDLPIPSEEYAYKDFELVCSRKLGNTIVCTYVLDFFTDSPFCFTAVLQPVGSPSLWERVKYMSSKVKLLVHRKKRWLVVDFYTSDAYGKYVEQKVRKMKDGWDVLATTLGPSWEERDEQLIYEEIWGKEEKTRQNEETERLYKEYIGSRDNTKNSITQL